MSRRLLSLLLVAGISLIGLVLNSLLGYVPNLYPDVFTEQPQLFWSLVVGCLVLLAVYGLGQRQHAPSTVPLPTQDTPASSARHPARNLQFRCNSIARDKVGSLKGVRSTSIEAISKACLTGRLYLPGYYIIDVIHIIQEHTYACL